jgi:UPF0271 protein
MISAGAAMQFIDLNSDLGESFGPWTMGADAEMLKLVSSANVACGGHASDPETMYRTLVLARENGVVVGAHPGYPDILGFGRRKLPCTPKEAQRFCTAQIGSLIAMSALAGTVVRYVKPHGALNNVASEDAVLAEALVLGIRAIGGLALLATAGTELSKAGHRLGVPTYEEVFADRAYTAKGQLVPRSHPRAMITDEKEASDRLIGFLRTGKMPSIEGTDIALPAHSICIHGDSPHAVVMGRYLRQRLEAEGLNIRSFLA